MPVACHLPVETRGSRQVRVALPHDATFFDCKQALRLLSAVKQSYFLGSRGWCFREEDRSLSRRLLFSSQPRGDIQISGSEPQLID